uniref:Putative ecdysteroid kinase n=1 Tax=Nyssomyia neivai TaxID=330878 RepID=A0A1L8DYI8_9DIPT
MAETVENGNGPIQYNKDELTPPDFLNEEFFLDVLRGVENDRGLTITNFKMIPGTKPGDHFASIMFKAIISYTSRGKVVLDRSLVVKTMPVEEGMKKEMFEEMPVFDREIDMYTKILPEMGRLMQSIGDHEELAPRLLYHSKSPFILIFEDITKFGYEMHQGFLGFDNTVKIAKKLAKFHALSFYINDNKYANKLDLPQYEGILLTDKTIEKFQVFCDGLGQMAEVVREWPGFAEIADKVNKIKGTFLRTLINVYKPNPEPRFNVLCHSDFHIKNMMFIKNKEDIDKIFLLDFQMSFWGTPALDVLYLLYAIGNASVRARRGEFVTIYHTAFTEYLNRLGCLRKGPSLLELNIDIMRIAHLEILLGLCFLPFFSLDFTKVDMEAVMEPTPEQMAEMHKMIYKNPEIVSILEEVLPALLYKGVLDE